MKQTKTPILLWLLLTISSSLYAQEGYIKVGMRGGNNATFGNFTTLSLEAHHNFENNLAVGGGIQGYTFDRFSAELRPSYALKLESATLNFGLLLHYTSQSSTHNYALGGGVGLTTKHFFATAGYYHRTLRSGTSSLIEPFNLYYELGVSCLPNIREWDLSVSLTNSRMFDLDRHYLPALVVDSWWHPSDKASVTLGVCYKPTGVFHISSDYYQLYANIGLCYRW